MTRFLGLFAPGFISDVRKKHTFLHMVFFAKEHKKTVKTIGFTAENRICKKVWVYTIFNSWNIFYKGDFSMSKRFLSILLAVMLLLTSLLPNMWGALADDGDYENLTADWSVVNTDQVTRIDPLGISGKAALGGWEADAHDVGTEPTKSDRTGIKFTPYVKNVNTKALIDKGYNYLTAYFKADCTDPNSIYPYGGDDATLTFIFTFAEDKYDRLVVTRTVAKSDIRAGYIEASISFASMPGTNIADCAINSIEIWIGKCTDWPLKLRISDLIATKTSTAPEELGYDNITSDWPVENTAQATRIDPLGIGERPALGGWETDAHDLDTEPTKTDRTGLKFKPYEKNVSTKALHDKGYKYLTAHFKADCADPNSIAPYGGDDATLTFIFTYAADKYDRLVVTKTVSRADVLAGYIEVNLALSAMPGYDAADCEINSIEIWMGKNMSWPLKVYMSDLIATKTSAASEDLGYDNITSNWPVENTAQATRIDPLGISGKPMLGGWETDAHDVGTEPTKTDRTGIKFKPYEKNVETKALLDKGYNYLTAYFKAVCADPNSIYPHGGTDATLTFNITFAADKYPAMSITKTVSRADIIAGFVEVNIALADIPNSDKADCAINSLEIWIGKNMSWPLKLYISDLIATETGVIVEDPSELNLTNGWALAPDYRANATRLTPAGVSEKPALGGWKIFGAAGDEYANWVGLEHEWYTKYISLAKIAEYDFFRFYVKIDDPDAFTGLGLNVALNIAPGNGAGYYERHFPIQPVSKVAAAADWVRVDIPISDYLTFVAPNTDIWDIQVLVTNKVSNKSCNFYCTDVLAVKDDGTVVFPTRKTLNLNAISPMHSQWAGITEYITDGNIDPTNPMLAGYKLSFPKDSPWMAYDSMWDVLLPSLKDYEYLEFFIKTEGYTPDIPRYKLPLEVGFYMHTIDTVNTFSDIAVVDDVSIEQAEAGWVKVQVPLTKFTHLNKERDNALEFCIRVQFKNIDKAAKLYVSEVYAVHELDYVRGDNTIKTVDRLTAAPMQENLVEFELDVNYDEFLNPFNPDELALEAEFVSPTGKVTNVSGFYYQAYNYATVNGKKTLAGESAKPSFRIRFTPREVGNYTYTFNFLAGKALKSTKSGNFTTVADTTGKKGYIKVEPNNKQTFMFEDGTPYIPIGQNLNWTEPNDLNDAYQYYEDRLNGMGSGNANFARIWLSPWTFGLYDFGKEEKRSAATMDNFINRMNQSYILDDVFGLLEKNGIYIMLATWQHCMLSGTEPFDPAWGWCPIRDVNGGPLAYEDIIDFFGNPEIIKMEKMYARYVVARWGYSQNIMCYELFNEIDNTDASRDAMNTTNNNIVNAWQREMAAYFKSIDPYKHLITCSTANFEQYRTVGGRPVATGNDQPLLYVEGFDFINSHMYDNTFVTRIPEVQKKLHEKYNMPVLFGEIGITPGPFVKDPDLFSLSQVLWAGMMGSGGGGAINWWWEKVHENNGYYRFKTVSDFAAMIPWRDTGIKHVTLSDVAVSIRRINPYGYQGSNYLYLWIEDVSVNAYSSSAVTKVTREWYPLIKSSTITAKNLAKGEYTAKWLDSITGEIVSQEIVEVTGNTLVLAMPEWRMDITLALTPKEADDVDINPPAPPVEDPEDEDEPRDPDKEYGAIGGQLLDPDGEPIAYAKLRLNPTGKTVETDEDGNFEFKDVEVGTYSLVFVDENGEEFEIMAEIVVENNILITLRLAYDAESGEGEGEIISEEEIDKNDDEEIKDNPNNEPKPSEEDGFKDDVKTGAESAANTVAIVVMVAGMVGAVILRKRKKSQNQ